MIVRTLQSAEPIMLFGCDARLLVKTTDNVGHVLIDTKIGAGTVGVIEDDYLATFDAHAHYCIDGRGACTINGNDYRIAPGTLVATSTVHNVSIRADSDLRIASVFGWNSETQSIVVRGLGEIRGTERDVFWGNGWSRRLLVRKDGMGFALCITTGNPDTDSRMQYRNNHESCYYLSGTGEYEWETGKYPIETGLEQATVFIMNQHDTHHMRVKNESVCISIFVPPIEGTERHDFSKTEASCY